MVSVMSNICTTGVDYFYKEEKSYLKCTSGVPAVVQWVNDPACLCGGSGLLPGLVQWVKDLVLL